MAARFTWYYKLPCLLLLTPVLLPTPLLTVREKRRKWRWKWSGRYEVKGRCWMDGNRRVRTNPWNWRHSLVGKWRRREGKQATAPAVSVSLMSGFAVIRHGVPGTTEYEYLTTRILLRPSFFLFWRFLNHKFLERYCREKQQLFTHEVFESCFARFFSF